MEGKVKTGFFHHEGTEKIKIFFTARDAEEMQARKS